MKAKTKAFFTRLGCRVGWRMSPRWYNLTMAAGPQCAAHVVEPAFSVEELVGRLKNGNSYRADKWRGRLDTLRHPRCVQKAITSGTPLGDCEDHAGYSAAALLTSGIATSADLVSVQFQHKTTGEISGHALCRFRKHDDPLFYTMDYGMPFASADPWGFVQHVCEVYDAKPVFACTMRIAEVLPDDSLLLVPGKAKGFR